MIGLASLFPENHIKTDVVGAANSQVTTRADRHLNTDKVWLRKVGCGEDGSVVEIKRKALTAGKSVAPGSGFQDVFHQGPWG